MPKVDGWFKVERKILASDIWNDPEPFDVRSAWIDLVAMANYGDVKTDYSGTVGRGQIFTSLQALADRWHWSKKKVRHYLGTLRASLMVTVEGTPRGTLITLINYGKYQGQGHTEGHSLGHSLGHTEGTQDKNIRSKERKKASAPASLEEKIEAMKRFAAKHREEENNDKG